MAISLTLFPVTATPPPSSLFSFNRLSRSHHHHFSYFSSSSQTEKLRATAWRFAFATRAKSLATMAAVNEECTGNLKRQLAKLFDVSLKVTVPDEPSVEPLVAASAPGKFGDYQCNNAMGLWSIIKGKGTQFKGPPAVGQALVKSLPTSEMVESCSVAGPGFINVVLSPKWMAKSIENMLIDGVDTWAPSLPVKRAVVDFSSPNIAKEMHVGHLRSTIIGDTIARMLEYSKVEVLRRNHVGDWGTQFGMLIEYLFEKFPDTDSVTETAIGDLQVFYKASKHKFDMDEEFKEKAQQAVVRLQGGDPLYRKAWAKICDISRTEFAMVYQRLRVELEEKGESFYNPYISKVIEELNTKGLVEESEGARVIFLEGFNIPLMVVKSDGGFNYASTDLTALWYRLNEEEAEWIIYVTDVGQQQHFNMFFKAARKAGWLPDSDETYPRVNHVGFGLVLGEDGKRFRTRATDVVRLVDLLDEAKTRSKIALVEHGKDKEWTPEELDQTAEAIGYGAVKYADLKNNRLTNYTFSFDQMLNDKGNTAVYLLYAHARICSIIRKSGKDIEELKKTGNLALDHPDERALGLHLLRFAETVEEACTNLLPSVLCEYLYSLSDYYTKFYSNCQVNGSPEETSRLLLCEATAIVMRKCFHLLGITPVYKI
ncbi:PREDICTED: arginine--tRNA ligase, chloroplastic/mitochondrial-like isoform X1 [Camelina sativa]|uniref:arginine--tRNA ligase n=2 Tax=Camelina sativa TaxID=90675 RepID=A0ABM0UYT3_CAMSA|nr:PREDICTED: arginine--tRNA ligase, chloroplastic/mitochondrial-like isoform X1 [Camelina sativa]